MRTIDTEGWKVEIGDTILASKAGLGVYRFNTLPECAIWLWGMGYARAMHTLMTIVNGHPF